ncbi:cytochrome P450 [Russula ochroleuca]|uniref:Cytochrome P450 n=1 Tax=Russula ochroleuca TaxID=152965 RepID=A0A9P5MSN1_9AGAM|nr:cytochrome P450 [Russula ochroleuca]
MPADEFSLRVSFLMGFFVVLSLFVSRYFRRDPMLDAIPTVGFSDPILSYFSALRFIFDGVRMLKEGYQKTRPGLFKIANFRRWMVLAAGSELIEDVRKAPDDLLSMNEPAIEFLQPEYTLDLLNMNDSFHTDVIRSKLTRNIAVTFKEVREELIMAIDDFIPMRGDEWVKVPILETLQRVICRATNRIFVGVPLCRDYDYQTLNLTFAVNVVKFGLVISLFPKPLKPIVSRMLSNLPSQIQQEIEFIRPMVEERFAKMEEYGDDWDDKPNDLLMWLMNEAKGVERSVEGVARRLLLVNFAAIHSTSLTFTQVLYRLLANPEYIEPLREEVDAVIKEEGWTKAGIDKMHKLDSFLRETQRLDGLGLLAVSRLALRPFTFSNGVTVPAGTLVSIPASTTHTDERIYPNPDEFDGFRFAKLRESEGDTLTSRHQTVSTSTEHLAFGIGRHTCPGRFFAVNEVKALFAHIVATYDVKFEEGKGVPREVCIAGLRFPGNSNVMFRTRQK